MASLSATIKSIQNLMRQDAGVDGDAQRISQLVWLLFLKIFDDKEQDDEAQQDDYHSPIPEELRWRSWAANDEGLTGEGLLEFVNDKLFPQLKNLTPKGPADRAHLVRSIFEDSYNYMKSGTLLRQVVDALQKGIDYTSRQERHLFNDIYEQILRDLQSAGNAGEFYTPRAVTQLLTELVAPTYEGGRLTMDPACGTGGFLVNALEYMRQQQPLTTAEQQHDWQHSVRGYEKKPLPHSLATTNLLLHGVEVPQAVQHANTLKAWKELPMVDFILTNPPFGGLEESAVASGFPVNFRTTETADLFLYLLIEKLKTNGRAGVVLPDGSLFGESGVKLRVKEHLLQQCNLHTIVRLPNGVFAPYTGIRTNLLLFDKTGPTKAVWYYEHPYPAGVKNYSKTRPVRIEEFDELKRWMNNRYANENAWEVSIEDIKARGYNLDIKNPHQGEIEREYNSGELLEQLEKSFASSLSKLEKIRAALNA
ncbi:SAM-dependent DNA methyltransferase [Hymenobacter sp. BT523]|uniref:type I restriction-modification system subunit M n=1 Tax=Hymenobacter sp. BT523 TaxID=2795725 RepID=UPI0018EC1A16|nr:class I SAM-dependent DNA methyltransferase [Hymenobacter sp. BT523]MBJ6111787.1 SAM-dependent DNA methyltransferase [Hymenobacter sp. BT523]